MGQLVRVGIFVSDCNLVSRTSRNCILSGSQGCDSSRDYVEACTSTTTPAASIVSVEISYRVGPPRQKRVSINVGASVNDCTCIEEGFRAVDRNGDRWIDE